MIDVILKRTNLADTLVGKRPKWSLFVAFNYGNDPKYVTVLKCIELKYFKYYGSGKPHHQ